jgi:plasmid stabilization system protein ParE
MEEGNTITIQYNRKALHDIDQIEQYIAEKGYPETAVSYTDRLMAHTRRLTVMPERNTLCKFPEFARKNFHCSVFEKTYVIVYLITKTEITIKRVIHGSRLNY